MPNIKSAVKRVRKTEEVEHRNISQKNAMRTAVKRAKTAIETNASEKDELVSFALKKSRQSSST
ncbi:putative ribosomal protein S20 [Staphylococcus pettenkoferi VCU012]|nr:putative ribosomal protein S20 [Staphylococcus pettenkoferi VCU012]